MSGKIRRLETKSSAGNLEEQVQNLDALLDSQQSALRDLLLTQSTTGEDDDSLADEWNDLAHSEEQLRRELGSAKLPSLSSRSVAISTVDEADAFASETSKLVSTPELKAIYTRVIEPIDVAAVDKSEIRNRQTFSQSRRPLNLGREERRDLLLERISTWQAQRAFQSFSGEDPASYPLDWDDEVGLSPTSGVHRNHPIENEEQAPIAFRKNSWEDFGKSWIKGVRLPGTMKSQSWDHGDTKRRRTGQVGSPYFKGSDLGDDPVFTPRLEGMHSQPSNSGRMSPSSDDEMTLNRPYTARRSTSAGDIGLTNNHRNVFRHRQNTTNNVVERILLSGNTVETPIRSNRLATLSASPPDIPLLQKRSKSDLFMLSHDDFMIRPRTLPATVASAETSGQEISAPLQCQEDFMVPGTLTEVSPIDYSYYSDSDTSKQTNRVTLSNLLVSTLGRSPDIGHERTKLERNDSTDIHSDESVMDDIPINKDGPIVSGIPSSLTPARNIDDDRKDSSPIESVTLASGSFAYGVEPRPVHNPSDGDSLPPKWSPSSSAGSQGQWCDRNSSPESNHTDPVRLLNSEYMVHREELYPEFDFYGPIRKTDSESESKAPSLVSSGVNSYATPEQEDDGNHDGTVEVKEHDRHQDEDHRSYSGTASCSQSYQSAKESDASSLHFTYSDDNLLGALDDSMQDADIDLFGETNCNAHGNIGNISETPPRITQNTVKTKGDGSPSGYSQMSDSDSSQSDLFIHDDTAKRRVRRNYFFWSVVLVVVVGAVVGVPFGMSLDDRRSTSSDRSSAGETANTLSPTRGLASKQPSLRPSARPLLRPTEHPSQQLSEKPSVRPTDGVAQGASAQPSLRPSSNPVTVYSNIPVHSIQSEAPSVFGGWDVPTPVSLTPVASGEHHDSLSIESAIPTVVPSTAPSMLPSILPSHFQSDYPSGFPSHFPARFIDSSDLLILLVSISFDGGEALRDEATPQHAAYAWLSRSSNLVYLPTDRIIQRYVLATLFFSTRGEGWTANENWLSDGDECLWFSRTPGSICDPDGAVQMLNLEYNNMEGTIPPEIGILSNSLTQIDFGGGPHKALFGTLPRELARLTKLEHLRAANNGFTGTLPRELIALTSLEMLDLNGNHLAGEFPRDVARLTALQTLNFAFNNFTGVLPNGIGDLTNLTSLFLNRNHFHGPIPASIGRLFGLRTLSLAGNRITSIPTEMGNLRNMIFLFLQDNRLTGNLISEIGLMRSLRYLSVARNNLNGTVPSELGNLRDMNELDLSINSFTGPIPNEIGLINNRLRILRLNGNRLTGQVPEGFSALTRINSIMLQGNELTGTMPTSVCEVFNETLPTVAVDCPKLDCPCCNYCCDEKHMCECRYHGTRQEWMCFR